MQDSLRGNNCERFYTRLDCHGYVVICIVTLTMDTAFGLMHIVTMLQNYKKMSHLNFLPLFAVPSILFSGKFAENHVAMVASIYNNFPYPDRKSPVHVLVNKMIFDSKVMEV